MRACTTDQGALGDKSGLSMGFCIETVRQTGIQRGNGTRAGEPLHVMSRRHRDRDFPVCQPAHPAFPAKSRPDHRPRTIFVLERRNSNRNRKHHRVLGRRRIDHYMRERGKSSSPITLICCVMTAVSLPSRCHWIRKSGRRGGGDSDQGKYPCHLAIRAYAWMGLGTGAARNYVADFFDHERVLGQPEERHIETTVHDCYAVSCRILKIASAVAYMFIKYGRRAVLKLL